MFKEKKSCSKERGGKKNNQKSIISFVPEGSHGDEQLHLTLAVRLIIFFLKIKK